MVGLDGAASRNSLLCLGGGSRKRASMPYRLHCQPPPAIGCAAALRPARLALSRGNGHVSNGGRSFPTANPTASNTVRGVPRKASISQRRHSGDLSFHLAPAWSRPPPDVPKGLEKGTSNAVPPEGSETEWTREEGRVTVGEDSTSSPLGL